MNETEWIGAIALNKALKRVGEKLVPDLSKPVRMPNSVSVSWVLDAIDRAGVPSYEMTKFSNAQRRKVRREMQRSRDELAKEIREQRKLLRSGNRTQRRYAYLYFNGDRAHKESRDYRSHPIRDFRAGRLNPRTSESIV